MSPDHRWHSKYLVSTRLRRNDMCWPPLIRRHHRPHSRYAGPKSPRRWFSTETAGWCSDSSAPAKTMYSLIDQKTFASLLEAGAQGRNHSRPAAFVRLEPAYKLLIGGDLRNLKETCAAAASHDN